MNFKIKKYETAHRAAILALSLKTWGPVFEKLKLAVEDYVYSNFYPRGWEVRQTDDIGKFLDTEGENAWVAIIENEVLGFIGIRFHNEDNMGEIYILAVDPNYQRKGIGRALIEKAFKQIKDANLSMIMVETGDDPGHQPSRASYEAAGFKRWPVARYFKQL